MQVCVWSTGSQQTWGTHMGGAQAANTCEAHACVYGAHAANTHGAHACVCGAQAASTHGAHICGGVQAASTQGARVCMCVASSSSNRWNILWHTLTQLDLPPCPEELRVTKVSQKDPDLLTRGDANSRLSTLAQSLPFPTAALHTPHATHSTGTCANWVGPAFRDTQCVTMRRRQQLATAGELQVSVARPSLCPTTSRYFPRCPRLGLEDYFLNREVPQHMAGSSMKNCSIRVGGRVQVTHQGATSSSPTALTECCAGSHLSERGWGLADFSAVGTPSFG